ncbi:glycosyltransferase family 4 protein [Calothrix sp. PCC 7507]|uniref:glycosyltransferase family 4 protein n=1 Tax=Calothrix sp. PCC 7507 TaxID=99598 RepID=UPI00029ECB27|nr:glycosyltransferase family 4 protein [Calothrix sp. PCC 7507]AFY34482.1 glycosyl transferase group 1 [Calothrix sp. PCC 7507]
MKVLVSAYACRPDMGSEPGLGWNTIQELAKKHQVWVLTREDNRLFIDAEIKKKSIPRLEFIYSDLPGIKWGEIGFITRHLHYYLWQIQAYFVGRQLHQAIGFETLHHVTYGTYTYPSFLSLLPVPFIWGPVGGGESAPYAFWQDFNLRGKIYEMLRSWIRWCKEYDPFLRLTAKKSILAWGTTQDTAGKLQKLGAVNVRIFSAVGLSQSEIAKLSQFPIPDILPVKFFSIGRLLHWKGFHLGLRAFAQAAIPNSEYWILGDGPERQHLQTLTKKLGISEQIKFWGQLPREQIFQLLGESHILVHPSLHESGGFVCMEAMAAGRPVICLDLGGPALQVTEDTGFKIPAHTPEQTVCDLAKAMTRLALDADLRRQMGQAGQKLARENFAWEVKGQLLAQFYEEILRPIKKEYDRWNEQKLIQ